jgi:lactaldehyde dehydrogenase/glycolaldehyde dehydrogenase
MGPQVSATELDKTEQAVESARESGARVLTGGQRPTSEAYERGYWYEPTVLTDVEQDDDVIQQEVFGPVTPIVEIDSLDQAIEYANDSRYGLSSYVYTEDYRTAMRAAEDLEFGETYINRSLGEAWHGHHIGWKESGLGGEDGKYGFLKYTQLKTVYHDYA